MGARNAEGGAYGWTHSRTRCRSGRRGGDPTITHPLPRSLHDCASGPTWSGQPSTQNRDPPSVSRSTEVAQHQVTQDIGLPIDQGTRQRKDAARDSLTWHSYEIC